MIMASEKSCLKGMVELYEKTGGNVLAVEECDPSQAHKYGIVGVGDKVGTEGFKITEMVEKPAKGLHRPTSSSTAATSCSRRFSRSWKPRSAAPATKSS